MSYSTIYDLNGYTLTDGVQSQLVCDATINTARRMARTATGAWWSRTAELRNVIASRQLVTNGDRPPIGRAPAWQRED
jgi:hypothetical protein